VHRLFQGESEAGDPVIQVHATDSKLRLTHEEAVARARVRRVLSTETPGASKKCAPDPIRMDLVHLDGQAVPVNQIPCVPAQLSVDVLDETRRPVETQRLRTPQQDAGGDQSDEAVDGHGRRNIGDLEGAWREGVDVFQVKRARDAPRAT
jgi:hypothetical protein